MKRQYNYTKKNGFLKWSLLFLFFVSYAAIAKEIKIEQGISGNSITANAQISVQDPDLLGANFTTEKSATYVELKIDDFAGPFFWYKCQVSLKIIPINASYAPYNINLSVENNRYGNFGNFVDLDKHLVTMAYGAEVKVLSVIVDDLDNNQSLSYTPSNVSLTVSYEATRYYFFDSELPSSVPALSLAENFYLDASSNQSLPSQEVTVAWNEVHAVEEYELAWTWVDNYAENTMAAALSPALILLTEKEFERNCTRIQTSNLNYKIPLIYDNGYLVFRIRAIGRFENPDYNKKKFGHWNTTPATANPTVLSWGSQNIFQTYADSHSKNWQFQASYAENGKKKEVVSYFDGSLRNRQTVTKTNSNDKAIVGEVIYDEEGRPAVEILPVPTYEPILKYYQDFNRNSHEQTYSYQDFRPIDEGCDRMPVGMSSEYPYGASHYYSSQSEFQNNFQDFVPNAEKYPFSQIDYTHDNTGRIKRKGGVGMNHQLGSNHEMKYFYSVPSQEELNRLFGYSVGYVSHYKKNIVIDPNKQVSISYIDPQGRTIATALSSESPQNLQALDDEENNSLHAMMQTDLLNKLKVDDTDSNLDNNERFSSGYYGELIDGLRFDTQKVFVNEATEYKFEYSIIKSEAFKYDCHPNVYNYPFIYNLQRNIVDDCGNIMMTDATSTSQSIRIGSYTLDPEGNPNLSAASSSFSDVFVENLPVGAYGISKLLTVDGEALDKFTEDYIRRGKIDGCILEPLVPKANIEGCFHTCEECSDYYSTLKYNDEDEGEASYVTMMLADDSSFLNLDINSPTYAQAAALFIIRYKTEYRLLLQGCAKPCQDDGFIIGGEGNITSMNCDNSLSTLLSDMMPGGQYGVFPSDIDSEGNIIQNTVPITLEYLNTLKMSVYNENNEIYAVVGGIDPSNIDWRHPHFFDKDKIFPAYGQSGYNNENFKHYFKVNGEIDYVHILWDEEAQSFNPPIAFPGNPNPDPSDLQQVNIIDAEANLYQVEPQFLANVLDFIQLIPSRENWAMSLVKYHPEFHYLDYIYETCGIAKNVTFPFGEVYLNSDGFDALIGSKKTFSEALNAGFLQGPFTLLDKDPFFTEVHPKDATIVNVISTQDGVEIITPMPVVSSAFLALKKSIMMHALGQAVSIPDPNTNLGKYENTGLYLAYYIYRTIRCNGLDFSCPQPAIANSFDAVIQEVSTNFSEEDQDLFWTYYVSYYAGLKQKIQHVFLNMHATRQGFYNDCIGENNTQNYPKIVAVINKYPSQKETIWGLMGFPPTSLFSENGLFLRNNEKRFLPYDETYNSEESDQNVYQNMLAQGNYYYLSTTGNCPILNDLGIFLDSAAKASAMQLVFKGNNQTIPFNGGYLTPALFQAIGGSLGNPVTVAGSLINNNPASLSIQFDQGSNTIGPVTLTLPAGSHAWSNYGSQWKIVQVSRMSHTGTNGQLYNFSFLAKIHNNNDPANVFYEVVIQGTTTAILSCSTAPADAGNPDTVYIDPGVNSECTKKEDFTNALLGLIINLQNSGHINDGSYDLLANTAFVNSYLPEFFMINSSVGFVRWQDMGLNTYAIRIGIDQSQATAQLLLTLDLSLPITGLVINNLTASGNAHHIMARDQTNMWPGEIAGSIQWTTKDHNSLKFECCVPREQNAAVNNRTIADYLNSIKNVFNELLDHTEYLVADGLEIGTTTVLVDYPFVSADCVALLSNYENPEIFSHYRINQTSSGQYVLSFDFEGDITIGGGTYMSLFFNNLSQRVSEVNINEYYFQQYSNSQSETFSIDSSDGQVVFSDGTAGSAEIGTKNLKTFYFVPTCDCIPQAVQAVSCNSKYEDYNSFLLEYGIENYITDPYLTDLEIFCGLNYAYIIDGYFKYINTLDITPQNYATHPHYITLGAFGATVLNYGYADYDVVIHAFNIYITSQGVNYYLANSGEYYTDVNTIPSHLEYDLVDTWAEYAAYYVATNNVCPPKPLLPSVSFTVIADNPCLEFSESVHGAYNAEAYAEYINALKEQFRKRYLEEAIAEVVENYNLTFYDKEYQYTLYYYDQAGNLIQTVAPQGVDRLSAGPNTHINQYRFHNVEEEDPNLLPQHNFKTEYRYNSLNQLVWQKTPDGGETRFAYDLLGRIVASQNQKQNPLQVYSTPPLATLATNVSIDNNGTITKTSGTGWNAGGSTAKLLTGNGYVTRALEESLASNGNVMMGLSYQEGGIELGTINYALYTYTNNNVYIYENGTQIYVGAAYYEVGDILKVERKNGFIRYYKNNVILRTVAESNPGQPMLVDFSMNIPNSKIYKMQVVNFKGPNLFSYTCYDALGRIKEAGQLQAKPEMEALSINDDGLLIDAAQNNAPVAVDAVSGFPHNISTSQTEVTKTLYDSYEPFDPNDYLTAQPVRNTRNRVTGILTFDYANNATPLANHNTAIFYNYDIHGNVDEMVSKANINSEGLLRTVNYEYDLISGNVNKVIYQKNQGDQFIHHYNYDADNRIVDVQTSKDGTIWEKDASYEYYDHGPLARIVLGDKKVQGMDYAYTLQGWLKIVNSESLMALNNDMGRDGNYVSKDAYGYSLTYFDNDYKARQEGSINTSPITLAGLYEDRDLYNGNIKRMITSVRGLQEEILPTQDNRYVYDQLNRIFSMNSSSITIENLPTKTSFQSEDSYSSNYTYDKNGNLLTLNRTAPKLTGQGTAIEEMDILSYIYTPLTNKLEYVKDEVPANRFGENIDIDDQEPNNYVYDEIGQLIRDEAEKLEIDWRVDGKVKTIRKAAGQGEELIRFVYDGLGNRVGKFIEKDGRKTATQYARDAQGNVLGVYVDDNIEGYALKEHHIYGSSRLGLQSYENPKEVPEHYFRRLVGDKRYELTNHLGNVLSVVNDRKIVSSGMSLFDSDFFDINMHWNTIGNVNHGITQDQKMVVNCLASGAGVARHYVFQPGDVLTFQVSVTRGDGMPADYPLAFTVTHNDTGTILQRVPVPASGMVVCSAVRIPELAGDYEISITRAGNLADNATFYVDNFYIYLEEQSTADFVSLFLPDVLAYNDYYPFGMLVPNRHASSEGYRYGFNGKENDNEVLGEGNFQDYGMRMYDPRIARFPNVDPLTKKYPELTPYQFASNTPIQAIDLDGLEAFYIHGTWSNYATFPMLTKATVNEVFANTTGKMFEWTGYNTDEYRQIAGRQLAEHVAKNRDPGQALTLVGHSHGGNVAIIATNILKEEYNIKVDNLLTINTPVREYQLNNDVKTKHSNVYHKGDPVQANGGSDVVVPDKVKVTPAGNIPIYLGGRSLPAGEMGSAGRTFDNALNIEAEGFQNWNPLNFHDTHQRPGTFAKQLFELIRIIPRSEIKNETVPQTAKDKTDVPKPIIRQ